MAIGHRVGLALAALAWAGVLAAPAAAQTYSDGYKFLQAVEKQDQGEVESLISKSPTIVDTRDLTDGHTALHIAIKKHAFRWLSYLLGKGANPNLADKHGVTPLMLASEMGDVDSVSALAQSGARVDEANDTGETPLISAVHARDIPMIRVLLAAGADPDRADNSGRNARDYAKADSAGSAILSEIARHDSDKRASKSGHTYGPTL